MLEMSVYNVGFKYISSSFSEILSLDGVKVLF